MRGKGEQQAMILSAVTPDQLVPQDHPIRQVKPIVDQALAELSPTFNQMYARVGRPSIPPEHLLKGCLLIALYSIRSERQFCERLQYDLLFKWFLDLNIMDPAFDSSTFSKNKTRLLEHQVSRQFFNAVLAEARRRQLLSEDHFTARPDLQRVGPGRHQHLRTPAVPRHSLPQPVGEGAETPGRAQDLHQEARPRALHQRGEVAHGPDQRGSQIYPAVAVGR
jgi:transposase